MVELRGELHCFACARYLGEFESHPTEHGTGDLHVIEPEFAMENRAIMTPTGLRCSRCGGRVVTELMERIAA